mgnify:FL=1
MTHVVKTLRYGLPAGLEELTQLGRTLCRWRDEVLGYFDIRAASDSVEEITGRLEHFRGLAFRFRNLNHYMLVVIDPLGRTAGQDQCTLNREEPIMALEVSGRTD